MPIPFVLSDEQKFSMLVNTNQNLHSVLNQIDLNNHNIRDKRVVDEIDKLLPSIKIDKAAMSGWQTLRNSILENVAELQTRRSILAAMIVSGGAIARSDIDLTRCPNISQSVRDIRAAYQADVIAHRMPNLPGSQFAERGHQLGFLRPTSNSPSVVNTMVNSYQLLTKNMDLNSRLNVAIKRLLEDPSKTLFKGREWQMLDLAKLNDAYYKHFGKPIRVRSQRRAVSKQGKETRASYAPGNTTLRLLNFSCQDQQESSDDEVFWTGHYYFLQNLVDVYNEIDKGMRQGLDSEIELNMKWARNSWTTHLYKGITEQSGQQGINIIIGQQTIYNGFCPWVAGIIGVEDDNAEYEAIQATVEKIGDVADAVNMGAETVAVISGPTPLGVGAAAVASAAALVSTTADVTSAVVGIVNFFDKDDTIGFSILSGKGDYAQDHSLGIGTIPLANAITKVVQGSGARYEINAQESLTGPEKEVARTWYFRQITAMGPSKHQDPVGIWGGNGNDKVTIPFGQKVDKIINWDTNQHGSGHAEWKHAPQLVNNNTAAKGAIHWGVSGAGSVTYEPWVSAGIFSEPAAEKYQTEREID